MECHCKKYGHISLGRYGYTKGWWCGARCEQHEAIYDQLANAINAATAPYRERERLKRRRRRCKLAAYVFGISVIIGCWWVFLSWK